MLAKWGALYWEMFPLQRPDVEWLLLNQEELRKSYSILGPLSLSAADLQEADLSDLPLEECDLSFAQLDGSHLINTNLKNANLEYALLTGAHLEGADLRGAWLARSDLREAWLDQKTVLTGAHLFTQRNPSPAREYDPSVFLAGVRWNETDISSVADLDHFRRLGDDLIPWSLRLRVKLGGKDPFLAARVRRWQERIDRVGYQKYLSDAIAAYRQFSRALRGSGLPHLALRAEYRARQLERQVRHPFAVRRSIRFIRRRGDKAMKIIESREKLAQEQPASRKLMERTWFVFVLWLDKALRCGLNSVWYYCGRAASFLLDLICGYGYKPLRVLIAYAVTILVFARIYAIYPPQSNTPHGWNTIWFSMIAFHGRGVINGDIDPNARILWVPAIEAVVGLSIEALLVAVIIRRLFRD